MFVLVRHGHAGDKRAWSGPDVERPLSARGRAESVALSHVLRAAGVRRLVTSPTARCHQTLGPAADLLGIRIEADDVLLVDTSVVEVERLLSSPEADGAAFCTHGEVLNALADAWADGMAVVGEVDSLRGTPKGAAWVVSGYPGPNASATYVPPVVLAPA